MPDLHWYESHLETDSATDLSAETWYVTCNKERTWLLLEKCILKNIAGR